MIGGKRADAQGEDKGNVVAQTIEDLKPFIAELWHTPSGEPMATFHLSDGIQTHLPLASQDAGEFLNWRYFQLKGKPISDTTRKQVMEILCVQAKYVGAEHHVYSRIGTRDGHIYVDLGDESHQAVDIGPDGWMVIACQQVPVRFRRSKSALALPAPKPNGSLDDLRKIVPNITDSDWVLILGVLVGCFQSYGGRAFLEVLGEQGSGKTTLARLLIALIDPNEAPMRSLPRNEQDLLISVLGRSVVGFDNLSGFPVEMADALCRLSTGAGISTRTLYSNNEETITVAQAPCIWTSIEPQGIRRPDLQDRTITVHLDALGDGAVYAEREIWEAFEDLQPELLGALYSAVSTALRRVGEVQIDHLPRLADFATWVEAAAPAFGWDEGHFLDIFETSRAAASAMALDASPISALIIEMMQNRMTWEGTAAQLLNGLKARADDDTRKLRSFPKDATRLAGQLRRLVQPMLGAGVRISFDRSGRSRGIRIDRDDRLYDASAPPKED